MGCRIGCCIRMKMNSIVLCIFSKQFLAKNRIEVLEYE